MDKSASLKEVYFGQDYESDFEPDPVTENERNKRIDLATKEPLKYVPKPQKQVFTEECSKEQGRIRRFHELPLDAYTRHKKLINEYVLCYRGSTAKLKRNVITPCDPYAIDLETNSTKDKTDHDVIRENHRFLWDEDESPDTWEKCLAKKYYDKLFKEYCITDLSRFKENKIAMRWRTEKEVIDGKGQFFCGSIHCHEKEGLKSWEVNFGYTELGEKKNALVKLRLCPDCSDKLNFSRKRKEVLPKGKRVISEDEQPKKRHRSSSTEESLHQTPGENTGSSETNVEAVSQSEIWKQPIKGDIEISKDDEFEDYLADMLL